jgi:hypothetical protein
MCTDTHRTDQVCWQRRTGDEGSQDGSGSDSGSDSDEGSDSEGSGSDSDGSGSSDSDGGINCLLWYAAV